MSNPPRFQLNAIIRRDPDIAVMAGFQEELILPFLWAQVTTCPPGHLTTWAPDHLATWPPDHLVTWSPGHLTTWSPDHLVT